MRMALVVARNAMEADFCFVLQKNVFSILGVANLGFLSDSYRNGKQKAGPFMSMS
jgi:hypothetical protein